MIFTIWIVTPNNYVHTQSFMDWAISFRDSLRDLGHECEVVKDSALAKGKTIIFAAHLLKRRPSNLEYMIVYNLEQISPDCPWETPVMRQADEVWDYSLVNIEKLQEQGIAARHCEIGYHESLTKIPEDVDKDIDVLFYGSLNERRQKILVDLIESKIHTVPLFGMYGQDLDRWITRSKIVLNIHFYDSKIFEITRCGYLMANKKCIVSEPGHDIKLEKCYYNNIVFSDYSDIVSNCKLLLEGQKMIDFHAQAGFNEFKKHLQIEILKALI